MVASGFFVFNVAPIHWCEQIKTKNTGLRGKAGVSMLGLNQFFGKRPIRSVTYPNSRVNLEHTQDGCFFVQRCCPFKKLTEQSSEI